MRTGSFRCASAIAWIRLGIVAENNTVCRCAGASREDLLDVLGEAHVEHLVSLVEDHGGNVVEVQGASAQVVQRASGCRHDDVDTALQFADLPPDRLSAVDGQRPDVEGSAVPVQGG